MKKTVAKILITVLFFSAVLLGAAKINTLNAQEIYRVVSVGCNCLATTEFSSCGTRFGRNNIQWKSCAAVVVGGNKTCTYATGTVANATFWYVQACTPGPTRTPTPPTKYNCTCLATSTFSTCPGSFPGHPNSKRRVCTLSTTTTTTKCEKVGTVYYNYANCPGGPTRTPTPTGVNLACVCGATNTCHSSCDFNEFTTIELPGVSYANPIKCLLPVTLFNAAPVAARKTDWCRRPQKTKGDATGDDRITLHDYFYYVSARYGAKIPQSINPDFNGDGAVNNLDRLIIIKSL